MKGLKNDSGRMNVMYTERARTPWAVRTTNGLDLYGRIQLVKQDHIGGFGQVETRGGHIRVEQQNPNLPATKGVQQARAHEAAAMQVLKGMLVQQSGQRAVVPGKE